MKFSIKILNFRENSGNYWRNCVKNNRIELDLTRFYRILPDLTGISLDFEDFEVVWASLWGRYGFKDTPAILKNWGITGHIMKHFEWNWRP